MEKEIIVAPSVLSLDFSDTKGQIEELNQSAAKWIHYDVMDGNFVKNISFGSSVMKGLKMQTNLFFDVHLMVANPKYYAEVFKDAKADLITVHYEAFSSEEDLLEVAKYLHDNGVLAGVSLKPKTPINVLDNILKYFDLVLVMSVEPGFGGQSFDSEAISRISYLRNLIDTNHYNCKIEVDGGINSLTGKKCKEAGVDVLVAGSYIFKGEIAKQVDSLL